MDIKLVEQLIAAAQRSEFDRVEVKDGDFCLTLERGGACCGRPVAASVQPAAAEVSAAAAQAEAAEPPKADNAQDILSPLVGIFHELPGGKKVKPGDKLKKGAPVCTVEAMKLMNEINMPEDGAIEWVGAEEGATVEYGQMLFRYAKS